MSDKGASAGATLTLSQGWRDWEWDDERGSRPARTPSCDSPSGCMWAQSPGPTGPTLPRATII